MMPKTHSANNAPRE